MKYFVFLYLRIKEMSYDYDLEKSLKETTSE